MVTEDRFCVYIHELPDGRKYIGMTQQNPEKRFRNGYGYRFNDAFFSEITKIGWENINHVIVSSGLTIEEAAQLEIELIREYDTTSIMHGFNRDCGGISHKGLNKKEDAKLMLGENIKKFRERKGISMAELAECADIAAPQIAKYESGMTVPNAITAVAIAERLGVTVEQLVKGE